MAVDSSVEFLGDHSLLHPEGIDSPAMQRVPPLPGTHRLPGGMGASEAFAIDDAGQPYELAADGAEDEGEADDAPMSERDLITALESEEADAIDFVSTIAQERADMMDYYFGREFGNEEDNRSQAISTEVFDAVESLLPQVLKPFVSSDDVIAFEPEGPNDAPGCEQETAYVQMQLMRKNDGFGILRKWVWDGLAQKNGVVKYWWDTSAESAVERYFGLTQDVLMLILSDPDVEIIDGREYPAPQATMPAAQFMGGMLPPMLYDVTVRKREGAQGFARVENVPPEEFIISRDATEVNPKKARFVEHRRLVTVSELREMGFDVDDDIADAGGTGEISDITGSPEFLSRHSDEAFKGTRGGADRGSNRQVLAREMYYRVDFDGDGIAELRKIVMVGSEILRYTNGEQANEEVEEVPFCAWTPYIIPHKYFGVCPADMAMDFQLQKSTVQRQLLDNIYGINNNRSAISKKVNWEDMLTNVVDGYIRVNADTVDGHIMPLAPQSIVGELLPVIQYLDGQKENRLGFSRYNKGQTSNSISKDSSTATEVDAVTESSQERTQLISRTFAETGLKDLVLSLHGLIRRHGNAPDTFQMTNTWITVDPRQWRKRRNVTISVGLGTGNKSSQLAFFMQFGQMMQQAAQMGLADRQHFYNLGKKILALGGEKNVGLFLADPKQSPEPPQNKPESVQVQEAANQGLVQMEQIRAGASVTRTQMENESREKIAAQKDGIAGAKVASDANAKQQDAAVQVAELQLKAQEQQHQQQMEIKELVGAIGQLVGALQGARGGEAKGNGGGDDTLRTLLAAALLPKTAKKNPDGSWSSRIDG